MARAGSSEKGDSRMPRILSWVGCWSTAIPLRASGFGPRILAGYGLGKHPTLFSLAPTKETGSGTRWVHRLPASSTTSPTQCGKRRARNLSDFEFRSIAQVRMQR